MIGQKRMTSEEFLTLVEQYPDRRFDFVDGEIVEVSPSILHSRIQALLAALLVFYLRDHPQGLAVHTEALHDLAGTRFIPDVSVNPVGPHARPYFTEPPLLAVEIRSDTQSSEAQRRKARDYIAHGTRLVWLILPGESVEVYRPGAPVEVLTAADMLIGGDVLPGLSLQVRELLEL